MLFFPSIPGFSPYPTLRQNACCRCANRSPQSKQNRGRSGLSTAPGNGVCGQSPRFLLVVLALLAWFTAPGAAASTEEAALWAALRGGGHVALIRHALAPGVGDPDHFRFDDCRTQRNLSAEGRAQAAALGERFRANGIASARVFSSRWCRALDTARLLALGLVTPSPGLDSFFANRGAEADQVAAMRRLIATHADASTPLVLVTHQVNITALSGVFPNSGEVIVLRVEGDTLRLAGRL